MLYIRTGLYGTGSLVPVFGADFWYVSHWHKVCDKVVFMFMR